MSLGGINSEIAFLRSKTSSIFFPASQLSFLLLTSVFHRFLFGWYWYLKQGLAYTNISTLALCAHVCVILHSLNIGAFSPLKSEAKLLKGRGKHSFLKDPEVVFTDDVILFLILFWDLSQVAYSGWPQTCVTEAILELLISLPLSTGITGLLYHAQFWSSPSDCTTKQINSHPSTCCTEDLFIYY